MKDKLLELNSINEEYLISLFEYRSGKSKDTSFFKRLKKQKARVLTFLNNQVSKYDQK